MALSSRVRFLHTHEVYFASCPNAIPGFSALNEFRIAFWHSRYADMFRLGAFTPHSSRTTTPHTPVVGQNQRIALRFVPFRWNVRRELERYRSLSASARAAQDSFSEGGISAYMAEVYFASWPKVMPGLMALNWSRMAFW